MREYDSPLYSVNYHYRKCIFFPRFHSSPILQFYFDLTLKRNQNKSFAYNFKYTSSTRSRSENIFSMYSKFTHCDQSILITSQHCPSVSGDFSPPFSSLQTVGDCGTGTGAAAPPPPIAYYWVLRRSLPAGPQQEPGRRTKLGIGRDRTLYQIQ